MKGYASRSHKGRTAYRTPSRWLAGRPEAFKRTQNTKLENKYRPDKQMGSWKKMPPTKSESTEAGQ